MTESVFEYEYVFPAVKGFQAKKEYFVSMVPLSLIPKIFLFNEEEIIPELRAQRQLNKNRIPDLTRYIVDNTDSYVFSALTSSIDGKTKFIPAGDGASQRNNGTLHVEMSSTFLINDGQHRRAAIEQALREEPSLSDETIAVVFFLDKRLTRCQQMFSDLNRYAIRPSKSMGVLYDHRDDYAEITRLVVEEVSYFKTFVEKEKTNIAPKSSRLFTFSSIYSANKNLLNNIDLNQDEMVILCSEFWEYLGKLIQEWNLVKQNQLKPSEVRVDYIHTQGVTLQAIAKAGNALITNFPKDWKNKMMQFKEIDWKRSSTIWKGRAIENGRIQKSIRNINLISNYLKQYMNINLNNDELNLETDFRKTNS